MTVCPSRQRVSQIRPYSLEEARSQHKVANLKLLRIENLGS
jgi:hypothetical protein